MMPKFDYWIAITLGGSGLIVSFVFCYGERGSFLLAILSMIVILFGIIGLKRRSE
jgi:multidrug transporter EmrE-like cation transporter